MDPTEIMLNLEGVTPQEEDKESIFSLLNSLLRFTNVDVNLIVDKIIEQNHIGSILTRPIDPDDDSEDANMGVFGVCTVITPIQNVASDPVNSIFNFALESALECSENSEESRDFFDTVKAWRPKLALLIYDRFVNLPTAASIAQIESLCEELTGEPHIEYLLVVERVYKGDETGPTKFQLLEQELLEEYASCVHEIPLDVSEYGDIYEEDSNGTKLEGHPYRRFVVIRTDMVQQYIQKCHADVPNMVRGTHY